MPGVRPIGLLARLGASVCPSRAMCEAVAAKSPAAEARRVATINAPRTKTIERYYRLAVEPLPAKTIRSASLRCSAAFPGERSLRNLQRCAGRVARARVEAFPVSIVGKRLF